jgi:4'-phosphopantetheinyl transferase
MYVSSFTDELDHARRAALEDRLGAREQERLRMIPGEQQAVSYLLGHALLRYAVDEHAGGNAELTCRTAAPPSVEGGRWRVSLSHTEGWAVAALSDRRSVGVDIEREDRYDAFVARRALSHSEWADVCRLPEPDRRMEFVRIWTVKEACAKAIGAGLEAVRSISVEPGQSGRWRRIAWVALNAAPGIALAIAAEGGRIEPEIRTVRVESLAADAAAVASAV